VHYISVASNCHISVNPYIILIQTKIKSLVVKHLPLIPIARMTISPFHTEFLRASCSWEKGFSELSGPVRGSLLRTLLLPAALGSGAATPGRRKLHGEERSPVFSPQRIPLLVEGVLKRLSLRKLSMLGVYQPLRCAQLAEHTGSAPCPQGLSHNQRLSLSLGPVPMPPRSIHRSRSIPSSRSMSHPPCLSHSKSCPFTLE